MRLGLTLTVATLFALAVAGLAQVGCSPVGAVLTGGLMAGQSADDERDLSTQFDDAMIRGRVIRELAREVDINPLTLTIAVHQGHVTMAGVIPSRLMQREILDVVTRTEGVRSVVVNFQLPEQD